MNELLKEYFEAKLKKYKTMFDDRQAEISAKFALDDMVVSVRGQMEIYNDESIVCEYLKIEVEDAKSF